MRGFIVWGLFLLVGYATAGAVDGPHCAMQFANLDNPFGGPILIYAGMPKPEEVHYLAMTKPQRAAAIDKVKQKLMRTRYLVASRQWTQLTGELNDPSFMDGTGLTLWAPEAKTLFLSPQRLSEIAASPELMRKAKREILGTAQWESNDKCCTILGTRVQVLDPVTRLIVPEPAELVPLTLESTLLMNEEIIHHLQGLYQANGDLPLVSKAMTQPGYGARLRTELHKELLADPERLMNWMMVPPVLQRLGPSIGKFKYTVPEGTVGVTAAERVLITSLPAQLAALVKLDETGGSKTPEDRIFVSNVMRATAFYFTKFPNESKPLMDYILMSELREADVYLALRDMYGAKLIDSGWRDRYLSRQVADKLDQN